MPLLFERNTVSFEIVCCVSLLTHVNWMSLCEGHHWIISVPLCSDMHLTVGSHSVVLFPQSNTCLSVARTDFGPNTCFVLLPQCPTSFSQGHVLQANSQGCITISLTFNEGEDIQQLYSAACSEWAVAVLKVCNVPSLLCCCVWYGQLYLVWGWIGVCSSSGYEGASVSRWWFGVWWVSSS
jgi:hypothetical protein